MCWGRHALDRVAPPDEHKHGTGERDPTCVRPNITVVLEILYYFSAIMDFARGQHCPTPTAIRTVTCPPIATSAILLLLTCTSVITLLTSSYPAIEDP